jgi:hypothetical protein
MSNLFLQCVNQTQGDFSNNMDHLSILVCTKVLLKQESTMKNGISTEINFRLETVWPDLTNTEGAVSFNRPKKRPGTYV